jgi:predicted thioesterase
MDTDQTHIATGTTATAIGHVTTNETAQAMGSGDLPVYATPALVALLERAACACLAGRLPDGRTSVGTRMDIAHTAASPVGATVTACATVTDVSGRQIEFEVRAADTVGEIARGTHTRVVVDAERFADRANGRLAAR